MTLRFRLVLALVALVAVGLAVFGIATYIAVLAGAAPTPRRPAAGLGAVRDRSALRAGVAGVRPASALRAATGAGGGGPIVPSGTYAELRDPSGAVVATLQPWDSTRQPSLPDDLDPARSGPARVLDRLDRGLGPVAGLRLRVGPPRRRRHRRRGAHGRGDRVAQPPGAHRGARPPSRCSPRWPSGAWLILRRGLRPLEQMATSARSITAGDLSQRVAPADERTEVGQLGLALNTMLGEIEAAFAERDATEHRLRQFLADASHELRTPLTSIQGFAELFRLGGEQDHVDLAVILRRIEEESARMKVLVEDLLLLARLDETRPVERAPVDLAVLAADACSDAVAADPDRPVTLDAPGPIVVFGDDDHLRQAIANLVTNAVTPHRRRHPDRGVGRPDRRRTPPSSSATTAPGSTRTPSTTSSTGSGRPTAARVGSGAGLGLSIVAAIAQEHGGDISVANADGGGARFELTLPPP